MKYTIGQAADATGKPKSTISRAIKSGRISASKDGNKYQIDPSELHRVFPATVAQPVASNELQPAAQPITESTETALLRDIL
jgi:excisionase family DNA binding protein